MSGSGVRSVDINETWPKKSEAVTLEKRKLTRSLSFPTLSSDRLNSFKTFTPPLSPADVANTPPNTPSTGSRSSNASPQPDHSAQITLEPKETAAKTPTSPVSPAETNPSQLSKTPALNKTEPSTAPVPLPAGESDVSLKVKEKEKQKLEKEKALKRVIDNLVERVMAHPLLTKKLDNSKKHIVEASVMHMPREAKYVFAFYALSKLSLANVESKEKVAKTPEISVPVESDASKKEEKVLIHYERNLPLSTLYLARKAEEIKYVVDSEQLSFVVDSVMHSETNINKKYKAIQALNKAAEKTVTEKRPAKNKIVFDTKRAQKERAPEITVESVASSLNIYVKTFSSEFEEVKAKYHKKIEAYKKEGTPPGSPHSQNSTNEVEISVESGTISAVIPICYGTPEALTKAAFRVIVEKLRNAGIQKISVFYGQYDSIHEDQAKNAEEGKVELDKWKAENAKTLTDYAISEINHDSIVKTPGYQLADSIVDNLLLTDDAFCNTVVEDCAEYLSRKFKQEKINAREEKQNAVDVPATRAVQPVPVTVAAEAKAKPNDHLAPPQMHLSTEVEPLKVVVTPAAAGIGTQTVDVSGDSLGGARGDAKSETPTLLNEQALRLLFHEMTAGLYSSKSPDAIGKFNAVVLPLLQQPPAQHAQLSKAALSQSAHAAERVGFYAVAPEKREVHSRAPQPMTSVEHSIEQERHKPIVLRSS